MKYANQNHILGFDCSHWQPSIDWEKAKASGIQFAFVKITQGRIHYEGNFYNLKARIAEIKKHGIKLGYYHFCSPQAGNPETLARSEAANFNLHISDLPESDLPLVLDIEKYADAPKENPCKLPVGWTKESLTTYLKTFISELDKEVIIYTNKWIWTDDVNFKIYPLWVPFYQNKNYANIDPKFISINNPMPAGWTDWTIWQFTDKGEIDGVKGNVDLNWMKKEYFEKYRFSS
jgi:lysozyme